MRKARVWLCIALALIACARAGAEETLANSYAKITVAPERGGVITLLQRQNVPLLLPKHTGYDVAGSGTYLAMHVRCGSKALDISAVALQAEKKDRALVLRADLEAIGLVFTRTIRMASNESGFVVEDAFANPSPGVVTVVLQCRSTQVKERWRQSLRSWFGHEAGMQVKVAPVQIGETLELETPGAHAFWRTLGQFGINLLYQVQAPAGPLRVQQRIPGRASCYVEFVWTTPAITIPPAATVTVTHRALIDEWGRQGNQAASMARTDRVVSTVDLRAAGRTGEALHGAVTVVAAEARDVTLKLMAGPAGKLAPAFTQTMTLAPGRAAYHPFVLQPQTPGILTARVEVLDQTGQALSAASHQAVIDGDKIKDLDARWARVWKRFTRKPPEILVRGTWEAIGAELVHKAGHNPLRPKNKRPKDKIRKLFAFYEKHFPFYARMVKGAAKALNTSPLRIAARDIEMDAPHPACMGMLFLGPDGPYQVYTQESGNHDVSGMGYFQAVPDEGYAYHGYSLGGWGYVLGVNSAGLCTSNATLCEDGRTKEHGKKLAEKRIAEDKFFAPLPFHMMLATCKNVKEAVAFITNPMAPARSTGGNYLIADREGNAVLWQGTGALNHIIPYDPQQKGFFTCGNYPIPDAEGYFRIGGRPTWAENARLKERFLWAIGGHKQGRMTHTDAVSLLLTHNAGGFCQHNYENPAGLAVTISYVASLKNSEFWMSYGPPCRVQFMRYTLPTAAAAVEAKP